MENRTFTIKFTHVETGLLVEYMGETKDNNFSILEKIALLEFAKADLLEQLRPEFK